jgi:hypothetical protein
LSSLCFGFIASLLVLETPVALRPSELIFVQVVRHWNDQIFLNCPLRVIRGLVAFGYLNIERTS